VVTLLAIDDGDKVEPKLRPIEKEIFKFAKTDPDLPFCWREFYPKYRHGTIRNALLKLKRLNLIELWCRSSDAYYRFCSPNRKKPCKPMTVTHRVDRNGLRKVRFDFYAFIDSLEFEEVCRVHDVTFDLSIPKLYNMALSCGGYSIIPKSKDIQFESFEWSNNRLLKVVLHPNERVTCYLKSSECPVEVSIGGLFDLTSFLGGVRTRLIDAVGQSNDKARRYLVPDLGGWLVVSWHYGKDGKKEISGPAFTVTFKTWADTLGRIYMKKSGKGYRARMETIEQPNKSLPEAFADKMQSSGDLPKC
jgi:hypothetical protein